MSVKLCPGCSKIKDHSQFGKDISKKCKITTYCRECSHKRDQDRYPKRRERQNQLGREYYQNNRERLIAKNNTYSRNNKEVINAHARLKYAVNIGKLKRPKECQVCNTKTNDIHGHHEDYSKALDVMWLCRSCHRKTHLEVMANGV